MAGAYDPLGDLAREAERRGATPEEAKAIAEDVVARGAQDAFNAGTDTGVIYGVVADVPVSKPAGGATYAEAAKAATTSSTPPVGDATQQVADLLAKMNDELNKRQATMDALDQAYRDATLRIQSFGAEQDLFNTLRQPGAGLFSLFTDRRAPGTQIPLPPSISALLQGRGIPLSGNIPGEPVFLDPDQLTNKLFQNVIRQMSSSDFNALTKDPTERANLISFGLLAGADPLRSLQVRQNALPTASTLRGSLFA